MEETTGDEVVPFTEERKHRRKRITKQKSTAEPDTDNDPVHVESTSSKDMSPKKSQTSVSSVDCWNDAEEEPVKRSSIKRRERRRSAQNGNSKMFSSMGRCKYGDITIALAEEGIVWSITSDKKGKDIEKPKVSTIPYYYIIEARRSQKTENRFSIYYVDESNHILKQFNLEIELSSQRDCVKWVKYISKIIKTSHKHPKRLRCYLSLTAGKKDAISLYQHKAEPLLTQLNVQADIVEISNTDDIYLDVKTLKWENYDAIVVVGGDGTVTAVIGALLKRCQSEECIDIRPGFRPVPTKLPIAILPAGYHNDVAQSVIGAVDFTTAVLHLVLGNRVKVDVASVFSKEKLIGWSFNSQYGFGSNVQMTSSTHKIFQGRKLEMAIGKNLSKSRLVPYDCDVHFIPSKNSAISYPTDDNICYRDCAVCRSHEEPARRGSSSSDQVEEIDPLNESHTSSTLIELTNEDQWSSVKGSFLWVGVYALPCRSDLASRGLSPCAHLQDGALDLVLVRECSRREFIRFLRRHGNSKNQLEYPFVESYRVKTVRFQPRMAVTWKHRDLDKTDIDYRMAIGGGGSRESSAESHLGAHTLEQRRPTVTEVVIDDLQDSDDERVDKEDKVTNGMTTNKGPHADRLRKAVSLCALDPEADGICGPEFSDSDEEGDIEFLDGPDSRESSAKGSMGPISSSQSSPIRGKTKVRGSSIDVRSFGSSVSRKTKLSEDADEKKKKKKTGLRRLSLFSFKTTAANPNPSYVKPSETPAERERERRLERLKRKEEKKRIKEEEKTKCSWMLDYSLIDQNELEISSHSQIIELFGRGISADLKPSDNRMIWLPLF